MRGTTAVYSGLKPEDYGRFADLTTRRIELGLDKRERLPPSPQ
jgi:hypothetical protein